MAKYHRNNLSTCYHCNRIRHISVSSTQKHFCLVFCNRLGWRFWGNSRSTQTMDSQIIQGKTSIKNNNRLREWVRDHRVHHKFSESDADPHNANRGFFFAHVGWLMMRKHPEVFKKGKSINCSDLFEDPVVVFFEKYFWPMKLFWCFIFPTMIPYLCWNETLYWSVMSCIARYVCGLNFTWLVNSAAHMFGNKPYDRKIQPVENLMVSILAMGEGWHNYHHTFPWDYKAAELGNYKVNATTLLLDLFAQIGWAYDLKSPSRELIQQVIDNHGDGSRRK
ncbi:acyl-CoA Delta-9 desaturase isoform X2 [Tribolium madens]|uniref:acyl-CoA Delta-9 desaturase isoform X2 n=1 Tax=Tribolium madens TaxID=41895 RepID=UPI001CF7583E|nr:acyl-CoA Delta-9 desaturase isoform X2 [Tribolium madens]